MTRAPATLGLLACLACTAGDPDPTSKPREETAVDGPTDEPVAETDTGEGTGPGPDPFAPHWQSGTRLQVWTFSVADAAVPAQVVDTTIGEACEARHATDGVRRCLPVGVDPGVVHGPTPFTYYADADCTQRVVAHEPRCAPSLHLTERDEGVTGCSETERWTVYRLSPRPVAPTLHRLIRGACVASGRVDDVDWFDVGEPVDPSAFVALEVFTEDSASGIGVWGLRSDDGMRQVVEAWDPGLGERCVSRTMHDDGSLRCLPRQAATVSRDGSGRAYWWTEGTCTDEPLAASERDACPVSDVVAEVWTGGAVQTWRLAERGDRFEPTAWRGSRCDEILADDRAERLFRVGAARDAASSPVLAQADHAAAEGATRWWTGADGERVIPVGASPFVDDAGRRCHPWETDAGGIVCLPEDAVQSLFGVSGLYADPACTEPLLEIASPPSDAPRLAYHLDAPTCRPLRHPAAVPFAVTLDGVWALGAAYAGPAYRVGPSGCAPADHDTVDSVAYPATPVPWAELPAVTLAPAP